MVEYLPDISYITIGKILIAYSNTCLVGSFISSVVYPGNLGIKCICCSVKSSSVSSLTRSAEVDMGASSCELENNDFLNILPFLLLRSP